MPICVPGPRLFPNSSTVSGGGFDEAALASRLDAIEQEISAPGAWDNPEKLTPVLREKSRLEKELTEIRELKTCHDEMQDWLEFAREALDSGEGSADEQEEALQSASDQSDLLAELLENMEMAMLLGDEDDSMDALLDIHPGAGGTEAQDWASMLLRMYLRWAERHKFSVEQLDYLPGDEAGLKAVTIRISGENIYGLLKGEKGIHRLIRISPFDSSGRRHTSFASVDIMPDVGQDIQIEIKDADLRIDVYRASGAGGQHVNKTESAVRITHVPTGIVAQCQDEKSQHSNRESAMRILRARLYANERSKLDALRQADYAGKDAIAFGSQLRTYTLQPYRLVKDHRTNTEVGDVDAVLDGRIDKLLRDYLLMRHGQKS